MLKLDVSQKVYSVNKELFLGAVFLAMVAHMGIRGPSLLEISLMVAGNVQIYFKSVEMLTEI